MLETNNKKIIIISSIILATILIIGLIFYFVFKPDGTKKEVSYGTNELYERLSNAQEYSFSTTYDGKNKMEYSKKVNKAYCFNVKDGNETKWLVQNGETYLIKDEDKAYYVYKNNESILNKIEDILEDLKDENFETSKEKIENKTYNYVEYNQLTDFTIMNFQNAKDSDIKKTRFYFDGKNLVYIKTILGNKQELLKVDISENVNDNLFEIPSDYEEK